METYDKSLDSLLSSANILMLYSYTVIPCEHNTSPSYFLQTHDESLDTKFTA